MKVAIIGMGNMGSNYAVMISQGKIPHMSLTAVTRIRPEKYNTIKDVLPKELKIFDSAETLYSAYDNGQVDLEAVIIVTPHLQHQEIACQAFKRGLSVLCDKPAGVYSRQAREMIQCFEECKSGFPKLQFGMIFQQRTNPVYKMMKEIADSKKYGNIKRVNWIVTDWFRPDPYYKTSSWKAKWKTDGGGVILNQCPHNLDLLQWICGMPKLVQGFCSEGKYHSIEVEDEATVFLEWENGATGIFTTSTGEAAGINRLEITFEDAYLVCENNQLNVFELAKKEKYLLEEKEDFFTKPQGEWKNIPVENGSGQYEELLENFATGDLIADGQDGLKNLLITNAVYLSSWENKKINIPQNSFEDELLFEKKFEELLRRKGN